MLRPRAITAAARPFLLSHAGEPSLAGALPRLSRST